MHETSTEANSLDSKVDRFTESGSLRFMGAKLYTDDPWLVKAMTEPASPTDRSDHIASRFPYLAAAILGAQNVLEKQLLVVDEFHFYKGRVRAMTSLAYGRQDSGWFDVINHSKCKIDPTMSVSINGKTHEIPTGDILTYESVASLAFDSTIEEPLTCAFNSCFGQGTLLARGTGVRPKPGMKITILDTDGA